jgi:hypothetical protein
MNNHQRTTTNQSTAAAIVELCFDDVTIDDHHSDTYELTTRNGISSTATTTANNNNQTIFVQQHAHQHSLPSQVTIKAGSPITSGHKKPGLFPNGSKQPTTTTNASNITKIQVGSSGAVTKTPSRPTVQQPHQPHTTPKQQLSYATAKSQPVNSGGTNSANSITTRSKLRRQQAVTTTTTTASNGNATKTPITQSVIRASAFSAVLKQHQSVTKTAVVNQSPGPNAAKPIGNVPSRPAPNKTPGNVPQRSSLFGSVAKSGNVTPGYCASSPVAAWKSAKQPALSNSTVINVTTGNKRREYKYRKKKYIEG